MKEIFVSKNILRWLCYFTAVSVLCLIFAILHPSTIDLDTSYIVCMYIVVEALILAIVLSILRKTDMLISWKLTAYYAIVVGGIMCINFLLSPINGENLLPFALSVFMLFVFLNLGLLEIIFVINLWKACMISIIAGLINALMVVVTITAY